VKFPDSNFFVDYDFIIDSVSIFILSPPAPVHDVEVMKKNNYNLHLILYPTVFIVDKENFEFQIIFIRILN
jgi:hypothetical protein